MYECSSRDESKEKIILYYISIRSQNILPLSSPPPPNNKPIKRTRLRPWNVYVHNILYYNSYDSWYSPPVVKYSIMIMIWYLGIYGCNNIYEIYIFSKILLSQCSIQTETLRVLRGYSIIVIEVRHHCRFK